MKYYRDSVTAKIMDLELNNHQVSKLKKKWLKCLGE